MRSILTNSRAGGNTSLQLSAKTYGTDQDECVSVLNHSDKLNEFPRSGEWVSVLFWEKGLEFLCKSLQQRLF